MLCFGFMLPGVPEVIILLFLAAGVAGVVALILGVVALIVNWPRLFGTHRQQDGQQGRPLATNPMLTNCPDCNHMISKRAAMCPQCGCPLDVSAQQ